MDEKGNLICKVVDELEVEANLTKNTREKLITIYGRPSIAADYHFKFLLLCGKILIETDVSNEKIPL